MWNSECEYSQLQIEKRARLGPEFVIAVIPTTANVAYRLCRASKCGDDDRSW